MLRLSGAFLQLESAHNTESADAMRRRLVAMQRLGLDTAIVQYAALDGVDLAPAVDHVLDAAAALGMPVWVGTPLRIDGWWQWQAFAPYLWGRSAAFARDGEATVRRWGGHPAFAGLYLPYETNGCASAGAMGEFLGGASRAAKAARPGTRVMASPFGNLVPGIPLSLPGWWLEHWWGKVLERAALDVLAYQDGVGGSPVQIVNVPSELEVLRRAGLRHGVAIWANLEAFERTTPLWQPFAASPASFARLRGQLAAATGHCERAIAFDFNHYLDPEIGPEQNALYSAYQSAFGPPGSYPA